MCFANKGLDEGRREVYLADAAAEVGGLSLVTLQQLPGVCGCMLAG